jgi:hypothetical protein
VSKKSEATCGDCYFQRAGLCALPGEAICPTFRRYAAALQPPVQPHLVPRPLATANAAA